MDNKNNLLKIFFANLASQLLVLIVLVALLISSGQNQYISIANKLYTAPVGFYYIALFYFIIGELLISIITLEIFNSARFGNNNLVKYILNGLIFPFLINLPIGLYIFGMNLFTATQSRRQISDDIVLNLAYTISLLVIIFVFVVNSCIRLLTTKIVGLYDRN